MNQKPVQSIFFLAQVFLLVSLLWFSDCNQAKASSWDPSKAGNASPYAAFLSNEDVFIEIPALRQYGNYTCGAACVQMLMNWLEPYEADINLTQYEELLGTTPENGTSPNAVLTYLEENGVDFAASQHLSLSALRQKLDAGHPVMMALQAWSSAEDGGYNLNDPFQPETYLSEGHWVICVGYCQSADQPYYLFNDPACVGHVMVYEDELDLRWIDRDGNGIVYDHFGIEILQKTNYSSTGLFYMD